MTEIQLKKDVKSRHPSLYLLVIIIPKMDGWMADVGFYVFFNRIFSHLGDNERLCAMEPRLRLERIPSQAALEPGTATSVSQRFTY